MLYGYPPYQLVVYPRIPKRTDDSTMVPAIIYPNVAVLNFVRVSDFGHAVVQRTSACAFLISSAHCAQ
jgi:hypothetical protein